MSFAGSIKAHVEKTTEQNREKTLLRAQKIASNIATIGVKLDEIKLRAGVVVYKQNREDAVAAIDKTLGIINKIAPGQLVASIEGNYTKCLDLPIGVTNLVTLGVRHVLTGRHLPYHWGVDTSGLDAPQAIDEEEITDQILLGLNTIF